MKLPSHFFLDRLGIHYEAHSFPTTTEKGAANVARVLGFSEKQAVKTLILVITHKSQRGEKLCSGVVQ